MSQIFPAESYFTVELNVKLITTIFSLVPQRRHYAARNTLQLRQSLCFTTDRQSMKFANCFFAQLSTTMPTGNQIAVGFHPGFVVVRMIRLGEPESRDRFSR